MPILKEEEIIVFRGYPSVLRQMPQLKKNLTQKFQTMYRLLAVKKENPASSAAEHDERSFSSTGVWIQGLDPTHGEPQESNLATSKSSNLRLFYLKYLLYRMYFGWPPFLHALLFWLAPPFKAIFLTCHPSNLTN